MPNFSAFMAVHMWAGEPMTPTFKQRCDELRKAAKAATPGHWEYERRLKEILPVATQKIMLDLAAERAKNLKLRDALSKATDDNECTGGDDFICMRQHPKEPKCWCTWCTCVAALAEEDVKK